MVFFELLLKNLVVVRVAKLGRLLLGVLDLRRGGLTRLPLYSRSVVIRHDESTLDLVKHLLIQSLKDVNRSKQPELNLVALYALFQLAHCGDKQCVQVLLQPHFLDGILTVVLLVPVFSNNDASILVFDLFEDELVKVNP